MKRFSLPGLLLLTLALPALALRADETSNEIKFTDPAKPGTLKISIARGDLHIRGVDAALATVKSEAKAVTATARKDGLRVLTTSSSFNLGEKDNVITLDATADGPGHPSDFNITVPRSTALVISNLWGGDISCAEIAGDIEIKNMNGRIKLEGIAGSALVETINGEIIANMRELHDGKPLSFTSINGEIVLRVPAEAKANVRLRSQNGSILTDFDEKVLVTKTESVGRSRRGPHTPGGAKNSVKSGDSDFHEDIHAAVHEVVRAGLDAAHEAGVAIREATAAAKEAMREAREENGDVPAAPLPPRPALPPMTGGKIVTGTLNEGGPEIQATTVNGDVTLRKLDGKK